MGKIKQWPVLLALVCLAGSAACNAAPAPQRCRHHATVSMGPENGFRITVPEDQWSPLNDSEEALTIAATVVPPLVGPLTLVQSAQGKEIARWQVRLGKPLGVSTRCSIGLTLASSSCGVGMEDVPHPVGGQYALELNGNQVLEAGLSFYLCD